MLCKDFIFNLQDYSRIDWLYKVVWTQTPVLIAIGFCLTRASQATQVIKNLVWRLHLGRRAQGSAVRA